VPSRLAIDWFPGTDPRVREALAVRFEVFVHEQGFPADQEVDDLDAIACHVVAWHDGKPVATARLATLDATRVQLGRVAVLPEFRRQGLATRLLELLLELARREGYQHAELRSQIEAIPVYERLGFVAEGPWTLEADVPHRLMRRAIAPLG